VSSIIHSQAAIRSAVVRSTVGLIAAVAALAMASPAAAGNGTPATAACWPGRIITHAPTLSAATNMLTYPNGTVLSNPLQTVGYKAHLFRATSSGWSHVVSGPLLQQNVRTFAEGQTSWFDTTSRQWVQGPTYFSITYRGRYRVAVEYFWYAFPGTSFGADYAYDWIYHYDYRTNPYSLGAQTVCDY
jgi:hypothetical protein